MHTEVLLSLWYKWYHLHLGEVINDVLLLHHLQAQELHLPLVLTVAVVTGPVQVIQRAWSPLEGTL